ncbi:MAG: GxxExxY protein [Bacteroidetes bacterium]|jgi:GxxExxY protein|nr:GxxExxY protein [Bacteroidota bacterium]MBT6686738.1 GxxExxY protein [Bacteroidota bacterium]MBT7144112.1 GxxExxY protein [Bacteroidota bacterium]MBT7492923.1 GxxExxY protein [Bacteroidota bacterium]
MHENEISKEILNAAFKIHTALCPGLLESTYKECLFYELNKVDLFIEKEKLLPLIYGAL